MPVQRCSWRFPEPAIQRAARRASCQRELACWKPVARSCAGPYAVYRLEQRRGDECDESAEDEDESRLEQPHSGARDVLRPLSLDARRVLEQLGKASRL